MQKQLQLTMLAFLAVGSIAQAADVQYDRGYQAVHAMAGCYLVDYSYTETEALLPGYTRDTRVYDVNTDKTVKEWIYTEDVTPERIRLQHVMFVTDKNGDFVSGSELKHTGEDWEYNAKFLYDFTGPSNWAVKDLTSQQGEWTRRITNLDDGLRYQCAAKWEKPSVLANAEWSCDNYAPIPGRETRDMGRKDYNTLERSTRVIVYTNNWLERQANTKVLDQAGVRTKIAKELGKNWYVRLPDSECAPALTFMQPRKAFWQVMREAWDKVLIGDKAFVEKTLPGRPSRYFKMIDLEDKYAQQDLTNQTVKTSAIDEILQLIQDYRQ